MYYRQNFLKADNYQIRNKYSLVSLCIPSFQYPPPDKDSALRLFNEYHMPNPLTKRNMSTPTEAKPHNDSIQSGIMTPLPAECPKITNSVAIPIKCVLYLLISCTLNCIFKKYFNELTTIPFYDTLASHQKIFDIDNLKAFVLKIYYTSINGVLSGNI